jgi:uncharacterized Tic20 family protein
MAEPDTRAAAAAHLSSLAAVIAVTAAAGRPVWWALALAAPGPLAAVAACARRGAFARAHAAEALRFDLSVALYVAVIAAGLRLTTVQTMWTNQLVPFLVLLYGLLALNWVMFTLIAAQRAGTGQQFTYPLAVRRPRRRRARQRSTVTYGRSL